MDKKQEFIENNGWLSTNLTIQEYLNNEKPKIRPSDDCILEFAQYTCNDIQNIKMYFNASCSLCGASMKNKTEIGISLKYGKDILCKKCLCNKFCFTENEYNDRIQALRESGCTLI